MKNRLFNYLLLTSSVIIIAACSQTNPDFIKYCEYQQQSNTISQQANTLYPNLKPNPEDKEQWEKRDQWVESQHKKLKEDMDIIGYSLDQEAIKQGWTPITCKEKGLL